MRFAYRLGLGTGLGWAGLGLGLQSKLQKHRVQVQTATVQKKYSAEPDQGYLTIQRIRARRRLGETGVDARSTLREEFTSMANQNRAAGCRSGTGDRTTSYAVLL